LFGSLHVSPLLEAPRLDALYELLNLVVFAVLKELLLIWLVCHADSLPQGIPSQQLPPNYRVGQRSSISFIISSAQRTAAAIADIVAGTRLTGSY